MAKANLEKVHKWYKDFVNKSQREVNFEKGNEVWLNIKKFPVVRRFEPQVFGPICGFIQNLGKEIS
jgi:hypothetical protein